MKQPTNWNDCIWTTDTIPTAMHFRCILEALRERQSLSNPADMPYPAGLYYDDILYLPERNMTLTYIQIQYCFLWFSWIWQSLLGFNDVGSDLYPEAYTYNTITKNGTGTITRSSKPIWLYKNALDIYEDKTSGKYNLGAMNEQSKLYYSNVEEGDYLLPIAKNSLIDTRIIMELLIRYKTEISKLTRMVYRAPEVINGYASNIYSKKCGVFDIFSTVYTRDEVFGKDDKYSQDYLYNPDFYPSWERIATFTTSNKGKKSKISASVSFTSKSHADHPSAFIKPSECRLYYDVSGTIIYGCGNAIIPYAFQKDSIVSAHVYSSSTTWSCIPYTDPDSGITECSDFEKDEEANGIYWDFGTGLSKGWNSLGKHTFGDIIKLLPEEGFGNKKPNQPSWFGNYPSKFNLDWGIDMIEFDFSDSLNFK